MYFLYYYMCNKHLRNKLHNFMPPPQSVGAVDLHYRTYENLVFATPPKMKKGLRLNFYRW